VRLRAVLTGGELLSNEQRSYLEKTFACKVYDWYNMWENVATALQCERGTYHLIPELSYVEILRNGRPCNPDEVGEIVGTHLGNYSMPLIRYNMNDLASPGRSGCDCGRNTQTVNIIGGRGRDIIVTPGGYVVLQNALISSKINPPLPVEKLQFYQARKDELLVRIVRGEGYTQEDTRRLITQLSTIFDGDVKVNCEYVDDIPRTASGKYPYVVSRVPLEW
jgi:phenylacetate-CoA ligase